MITEQLQANLMQNIKMDKVQEFMERHPNICPRCRKQRKYFRTVKVNNNILGENKEYNLCIYCADYVEKHS